MNKDTSSDCKIDSENIIDNEHNILLDHLRADLPQAHRTSIAVGYFFISGFAQIMDKLDKIENSNDPNHVMRLLISPTTNRATAEALLASNESMDAVKRSVITGEESEEKSVEIVKNQIKQTIEYMPQISQDKMAAIKIRDLIKRKKLQIKVYTKEQLHAKVYILEQDVPSMPRLAIIGSSNLSISGIKEHTELNLKINHSEDTKGLLQWFDCHWNEQSCKEFTREVADIIQESWAGTERSPSDVYHKAILHEHEKKFEDLKIKDRDLTRRAKKLLKFQSVAVSDAINKLEDYGGVMISDVVGTGKTLIGTAIIKYLVENHNSKPLIICPPHLIDMWKDYLKDYNIHGDAISRYKIATDDSLLDGYTNCDVILIDESHNFRHSSTNSYKALKSFMDEKTDESRIIMLSATPISNKLTDLKNQLELFPKDMLTRIPVLSSKTLHEYFKGAEVDGTITQKGIDDTRELLRHILIRRTRQQIIEKYADFDEEKKLHYIIVDGEKNYFPNRNLKNPSEYNINKVYNDSFQDIDDTLKNLSLARYNPGKFIKDEYVDNPDPKYDKYRDLKSHSLSLVGIVRTSLLKRVESSIQAFSDSVNNYTQSHQKFKKLLRNDVVPIGKDFQDIIYRTITDSDYDAYEGDIENIKSYYEIDAFHKDDWICEIQKDMDKFAKMAGYLQSSSDFTRHDDKLHILVDLLKVRNKDKILIFSESASTARYIANYLKTNKVQKEIGNRIVDQIDSKNNKSKNEIVWRFDPVNNNKPHKNIKEKVIDILVSTDVLSEGVNLQSGRVVINYDFHWNPVRLIQRVGRVDRIGTKHDEIEIINFLPTTEGEQSLQLRDKVAQKIQLIKRIMGSDYQILESTETLDPYSITNIYTCDDNVFDTKSSGILDIEDTKAEQEAENIKKNKKQFDMLKNMPYGIRSAVGNDKLLVACEAKEIIINEELSKEVSNRIFRQHYEVSSEGKLEEIFATKFLELLGNGAFITPSKIDSKYDELIAVAWKEFSRKVKYAAPHKPLKHQKFFKDKLEDISQSLGEDKVSYDLKEFIGQRMIVNHQPYKKLIEIHEEIDRGENEHKVVLQKLNDLCNEHSQTKYTKKVSKPRILYSMMIKT